MDVSNFDQYTKKWWNKHGKSVCAMSSSSLLKYEENLSRKPSVLTVWRWGIGSFTRWRLLPNTSHSNSHFKAFKCTRKHSKAKNSGAIWIKTMRRWKTVLHSRNAADCDGGWKINPTPNANNHVWKLDIQLNSLQCRIMIGGICKACCIMSF